MQRERQADEEARHADAGKQREAMKVGRIGKKRAPQGIEGCQQSAESEHQQQADIGAEFDQAEAHFGRGVVGGLLVIGAGNTVGERGGHLVAMRRDMAHLA